VTEAREFCVFVDPEVVIDGLISAAIEKRLEPRGFLGFVRPPAMEVARPPRTVWEGAP
jgi:hypothetical protein